MAHFVYPAGWSPPLPPTYVPGTVEYTLLWDQLFASVNGDAGGTWAPSAFITVGGSGLRLAGIAHELQASSGRLTVQPGAEIRLADTASAVTLPTIRVDGSSGAILLYVEAHASKLEVQSGAIAQINHGGFLNSYGKITLNSWGPGEFKAQTGTTSTWESGSTVNFATSDVNVQSNLKVNSGAFLTVQSGGTLTLTGNASVGAASTITFTAGAIFAGTIEAQAKIKHSGSGGRTVQRYTVLADASADLTVAADVYEVPANIAASRTLTVRHTGTVPEHGERIRVFRTNPGGVASLFSVTVVREDLTPLFIFAADRHNWLDLIFNGSSNEWRVCGFGPNLADGALTGTGLYGN